VEVPDLQIRVGGNFSAVQASGWSKDKGRGQGPPGPSPGSAPDDVSYRL